LIETFSQTTGRSYNSIIELLKDDEFRRLRIAEVNACGALHPYLKDHPNLYYSEWVPHAKPGEVHDGVRCEDLQRLTYPDNYFDIILTSETLEHVPDPDRAWQEINRTLKSGGYHIFTIPVISSQRQTIQRAQLVEGVRKDLLEPAYHSPWGREDVFVYTDFGMDVIEKLNGIGLRTEVFYLNPEMDLDVAVVFRSHKNGGHVEVAVKGTSPLLDWTGERYLPWLEEAAIGYEHLHRYAYATQLVQNKRVLDLACGEGYGSSLLAKTAESVVGIDIDERAIKHARNKYIKQNLEFKVGSITEVPITGERLFEVAVCFEALEHIEDHRKLLSEVKRLLTPDGVFIVSTPNKTVYTDEPQYNNPFHVHELYFDEFRELFEKHFKNVRFLGQRIYCNSNIWPVFAGEDTKAVEYVIDRNPKEFVFVENDKRIPLYFIAVACDADSGIEEAGSALIDVSDALLKQKDGQIRAHVTEQKRLAGEMGQLSATVRAQQQALKESDEKTNQLQSALGSQQRTLAMKDQEVMQLTAGREGLTREVAHLQSTVQSQQEVLAQKEKEVTQSVAERERLGQEASKFQVAVQVQEQYIRSIENSLAWILVARYRMVRDKFFPDGTRRRGIYNSLKEQFKRIFRIRSKGMVDILHNQLVSTAPIPELQNPEPVTRNQFEREFDELVRTQEARKSISTLPREAVKAKFSVVIPTKNGISEGFESTLRAIYAQKGIGELEVIVVDSGSVDGTAEIADSCGATVFSILPEQFNHGATRNYAAEQSTGDFLVFTVQDAIPATEDLFYEMAKALLADPKLAGVSVRQIPKSDADIYACWVMWNHYRFLFDTPPPMLSNPDEIDKLPAHQLRRLAGLDNVCSMVRRELWEKNRFKPTTFAEDLEFGLSCVRQGYSIGLLSHRGVIHSHTRSSFYTMSRHYVGMSVLLKLFGDSEPSWVEAVNHNQLFSSVKALYLAINEFAGRLDNSFPCNPVLVLEELLSFVAGGQGTVQKPYDHDGDPTLNKFFGRFDTVLEIDYPAINPCKLAFEVTINSILQFLADRYPVLVTAEMIAIFHKAFAGVAGSILGQYCFWQSQRGIKETQMKVLDNVLRGEMQA